MRNIIEEYGMAVLYMIAGLFLGGMLGKAIALVSAF